MFQRFKPNDKEFFALFEEGADILNQGSNLLSRLMERYEDMETRLDELVALEQKGDMVTEKIIDKLNQTFITPFDREDIYSLARELDEILDSICSAVEKMVIYKTGKPSNHFKELVVLLSGSTEQIRIAIGLLRNLKGNYSDIMDCFKEIKRLKNEGGRIYRYGVAEFFKEKDKADPIEILKWKEIFEQMETALDRCETIAKLIRGVVVKYA